MQTSFAVTVVNQEALANSPALGLGSAADFHSGFLRARRALERITSTFPARGVRGGFLEYISLQEDGLPFSV